MYYNMQFTTKIIYTHLQYIMITIIRLLVICQISIICSSQSASLCPISYVYSFPHPATLEPGNYSSKLYFCEYIFFKISHICDVILCLMPVIGRMDMLLQMAEFLYQLQLIVISAHVLVHPTSLIHSSTDTEVVSLSLPLLGMLP